MKIKKLIIWFASAFTLFLGGCISVDQDNRTTFELASDGSVKQVIVDDYDGSVTGEELEEYINGEITLFQGANSSEYVALEKCTVRRDKINITLSYSSVEAYADFNNVDCFNGSLKEAYDAGYDFNRVFYALNGVSVNYYELPRYCIDCALLILEEPAQVTLPGKLNIISSGVSVGQDNNIILNSEPDEAYDENFQAINTTPAFLIYYVD